MRNVNRIIALLLSLLLLLSGVTILSGCSNKQEKCEEAVILEIEQKIKEFKQRNPDDNVRYEINSITLDGHDAYIHVVYNIETTQKYEMYGNYKYYSSHNYYTLFASSIYLESVEMCAQIYGEAYVNGELQETKDKKTYGSSNSSSKKCSECGKSYSSSSGDIGMCSSCYMKLKKYAAENSGY